jgi:hypothetical protein
VKSDLDAILNREDSGCYWNGIMCNGSHAQSIYVCLDQIAKPTKNFSKIIQYSSVSSPAPVSNQFRKPVSKTHKKEPYQCPIASTINQ